MHSVPTARLNHVREGSLFTVTMAENSSPQTAAAIKAGGKSLGLVVQVVEARKSYGLRPRG